MEPIFIFLHLTQWPPLPSHRIGPPEPSSSARCPPVGFHPQIHVFWQACVILMCSSASSKALFPVNRAWKQHSPAGSSSRSSSSRWGHSSPLGFAHDSWATNKMLCMGNCPGREAEPAFRTGGRRGKTYRSNGSQQQREVWVERKVPGDVLPWSLMSFLPVRSQRKREASVQEDRGGCVLHRGPYLLA